MSPPSFAVFFTTPQDPISMYGLDEERKNATANICAVSEEREEDLGGRERKTRRQFTTAYTSKSVFGANNIHNQAQILINHLQVVIVQPQDQGNKSHPYPHAVVAGIERYPSQITRRMSKARQTKRSKVKPFIKVINYNHLMPTRYTLELEGLKGVVSSETFKEVSQREDAKKTIKKALEERYTSGKNRWFFTPLRRHHQIPTTPDEQRLMITQAFEQFSIGWDSAWRSHSISVENTDLRLLLFSK